MNGAPSDHFDGGMPSSLKYMFTENAYHVVPLNLHLARGHADVDAATVTERYAVVAYSYYPVGASSLSWWPDSRAAQVWDLLAGEQFLIEGMGHVSKSPAPLAMCVHGDTLAVLYYNQNASMRVDIRDLTAKGALLHSLVTRDGAQRSQPLDPMLEALLTMLNRCQYPKIAVSESHIAAACLFGPAGNLWLWDRRTGQLVFELHDIVDSGADDFELPSVALDLLGDCLMHGSEDHTAIVLRSAANPDVVQEVISAPEPGRTPYMMKFLGSTSKILYAVCDADDGDRCYVLERNAGSGAWSGKCIRLGEHFPGSLAEYGVYGSLAVTEDTIVCSRESELRIIDIKTEEFAMLGSTSEEEPSEDIKTVAVCGRQLLMVCSEWDEEKETSKDRVALYRPA